MSTARFGAGSLGWALPSIPPRTANTCSNEDSHSVRKLTAEGVGEQAKKALSFVILVPADNIHY